MCELFFFFEQKLDFVFYSILSLEGVKPSLTITMSLLRRKFKGVECPEDQEKLEAKEEEELLIGWGKERWSKKRSLLDYKTLSLIISIVIFILFYFGQVSLRPLHPRPYVLHGVHNHICKLKNTFDRQSRIGCKIEEAMNHYEVMLDRQSKTSEEAVVNYIKRYHRQPPPGFQDWVNFALLHNSTIIDDYDQIDIDLRPFRDFTSFDLKERIAAARTSWPTGQLGSIKVLDGLLSVDGNRHLGALSASTLELILEPIASKLPDLEILFNWYAEPRVRASNHLNDSSSNQVNFVDYSHIPTWQFITATCPATSFPKDFIHKNGPQSNVCENRDSLEKFHGFFNAPNQFRPTEDLVPMLSRAKVSTFDDILIPNVCYANADWRLFEVQDQKPYMEKRDSLYWRGSSTGQQKTKRNWATSHRVRFIRYLQWLSKMAVLIQEKPDEVPNGMTLSTAKSLARLNPTTFDAGFTLYVDCETQVCQALKAEMGISEMEEPSSVFNHKFLFDTDGQSMSCRFYRLLETNSVVFKSTIWTEWHGDRLVPWLHYVPVSVKLEEIPELLDYFINNPRGRQYGEIIATASRSWSERSLRVIDLTIYYYRLLLEFGAIMS